MNAGRLLDVETQRQTRRLSYRDPGSGCEVVVTNPRAEPTLWSQYLAGALRSYRAHDVERALDYSRIADGSSTSLLFVVLDDAGTVIGGTRSQGPYSCAEESHAYLEWGDVPERSPLCAALDSMVPEGLVESKTAWVAEDSPYRRDLVACLYRAPIHATGVLGARWGMGTAAEYAMRGWLRAGAAVDYDVPMVPYPDDRYLTRLIYWDRHRLFDQVNEDQRAALHFEGSQLGLPLIPQQATGSPVVTYGNDPDAIPLVLP